MVLVVCVRYFGGTELGVPGLRKAYEATAKGAIEQSSPGVVVYMSKIELYVTTMDIDRFLVKTKK